MERFLSLLQQNRYAVLGVLFAVVTLGIATVTGLPVESVPDISPRQVLVSVVAPGLATEEVEKLITFPVEASMAGIPGMVDLRSVSRSGVSVVYVQFADDTDINLDRTRVGERMALARAAIPVAGLSVNMGPLATGLGEIMQFEIAGRGFDAMELNRIMTWIVVPQIKLVPGVVDVNVNGGAEETFEVRLDERRLNTYGLSAGDVFRAVDANNAASGGAWIAHYAEQVVVVGRGLVRDLADFGAIAVKSGPNGTVIRLRDLGQVALGPRTRLGAVTRDGRGEIVNGVVLMEMGASSEKTIAAIEAALPSIRRALPAGVTLDPYYSRATLTHKTIATVKENLVIGAGLVILVLVIVIGDWRASLVIASVIPFALICAMMGMRAFGISANLLSLGAIDFGMIVDSSLVVVENVMTHRLADPDTDLRTLVVTSVRQVIRPVSFAILVIVMVYLPILTLEGIEGKMFRPMAQTVIMALLASLAYSLLCVPVIAALALRRSVPHDETRPVAFLRRFHRPAVSWCEAHSWPVFGATIGIFLVSAFLATRLGGEFIPQLQEGALVVTSTRLPSASLATSLRSVNRAERILKGFPDVLTVVSNTGTSAIPTDPMGINETDTFVFLKDPDQWKTARTQEGLVAAMNAALRAQVPDALFSWSQPVQMRMDDLLSGVRTQIAVSIYGDDLDVLSRLGDKVTAVLNSIPGAADVAAQGDGTIPFLHVDVDREAAGRLGVNMQDILDTVEAVGGHIGRPVVVNNALIGTQIRFEPDQVGSRDRIAGLRVRRGDSAGMVLLSQVARVTIEDGPPRISRDRIQRRMIVQANVRGRDLGSYVAAAQAAVARDVRLPPGYRMTWEGQFRNLQSAMQRLDIVVPIALALIFGLLVMALGSPLLALLVFV
ncbi:efflux RND transporter permease subunit, partial [Gluconacetobacter azotocaptans]